MPACASSGVPKIVIVISQPSQLLDETSPDWAPSLQLGYAAGEGKVLNKLARASRCRARQGKLKKQKVADEIRENKDVNIIIEQNNTIETAVETGTIVIETGTASLTELTGDNLGEMKNGVEMTRADNIALSTTVQELNKRILFLTISEHSLKENDQKVKFYTGIPLYNLLMLIFDLVSTNIEGNIQNALSKFQEFLIVMLRLRLNLAQQDLAYRFGVSHPTVCKILRKWIPVMASCLKRFIVSPDRETLRKTMPECFRASFGHSVAVIIDCFEIV